MKQNSGRFKKGHIMSNEIRQKISSSLKGHKTSKETKERISKGWKVFMEREKSLKHRNKEWLEKQYLELKKSAQEIAIEAKVSPSSIRYYLKEFNIPRRTLSEARKNSIKKGLQVWNKGKSLSEETKKKISQNMKELWKKEEYREHMCRAHMIGNGISSVRNKFYSCIAWKKVWRAIYKRENGFCQYCGRQTVISSNFHHSLFPNVHHIIGFECEILRLVLSNLMLVCKECHLWIHSKKNKKREFILEPTKENIEKMIQTQQTGTLLEYMYNVKIEQSG